MIKRIKKWFLKFFGFYEEPEQEKIEIPEKKYEPGLNRIYQTSNPQTNVNVPSRFTGTSMGGYNKTYDDTNPLTLTNEGHLAVGGICMQDGNLVIGRGFGIEIDNHSHSSNHSSEFYSSSCDSSSYSSSSSSSCSFDSSSSSCDTSSSSSCDSSSW